MARFRFPRYSHLGGKHKLAARAPKYARHKPGVMNKLETRYSLILDARKAAGEIVEYWFEAITLKLAPDCRYTVDFFVQLADGTFEAHETKGRWMDDARVKIKVAADKFPFSFVAWSYSKKTGWVNEVF